MEVKRRTFLASAAAACMAGFTGPVRAAATRVIGGPAFGTYWRAVLPKNADAPAARAVITECIAAIGRAMSPFREESEISRFNASSSTRWRPIGADTALVMAEGLRIARLTNGAFDPSVGPIVGRYGFGPITGTRAGTYQHLACRGRKARKAIPGVSFDPCGIAKGHALDRTAGRLDDLGINAFFLEIGGEVLARGRHPTGRAWQAGIERPVPGPLRFENILRLDGMALATSGDTVNGYSVAGRRYSHIIDPRSGAPVAGRVASVTVIHERAMTADALATALMAMGPEQGLALAGRLDLPALYILRAGGGALETVASPRFGAYVVA